MLQGLLVLLFGAGGHAQYADYLVEEVDPGGVAGVPVLVGYGFLGHAAALGTQHLLILILVQQIVRSEMIEQAPIALKPFEQPLIKLPLDHHIRRPLNRHKPQQHLLRFLPPNQHPQHLQNGFPILPNHRLRETPNRLIIQRKFQPFPNNLPGIVEGLHWR